jgi:hypothetical protein
VGDVPAQFGHHGLIVPGAGADEVLDRLAVPAGLGGDGLGGLTLEVAEFALRDDARQLMLFEAVEAGQVALQEILQLLAAAAHVVGSDVGIGQQGLGSGVVE